LCKRRRGSDGEHNGNERSSQSRFTHVILSILVARFVTSQRRNPFQPFEEFGGGVKPVASIS
jgi:hypothetical protein